MDPAIRIVLRYPKVKHLLRRSPYAFVPGVNNQPQGGEGQQVNQGINLHRKKCIRTYFRTVRPAVHQVKPVSLLQFRTQCEYRLYNKTQRSL